MWFYNAFFLWGLAAAVALPLLIHLLTRDRVQRVAFSTLRFFAKVSKRVLRRRKFQEMVLLAMRMLVCALVALAFAWPYITKPDKDADLTRAGKATVIVVDVSGSMSRPGVADAMKKELGEALGSLSENNEAAALISFSDSPDLLAPLTKEIARVRDAAKDVAPGSGGSDLAAALNKAREILKDVQAPDKRVVVISDFQRAAWRNYKPDDKLDAGTKLIVRAVAPAKSDNLAIIKAEYPASVVADKSPRKLLARIAHYSQQEVAGVEATLTIRGTAVSSQKVNLPAGGNADVLFHVAFDTPGDCPGAISIKANDADPVDNAAYFNTRVTPAIKVLIVNGSPDPRPLMDASFFPHLALDPQAALTKFTGNAGDTQRLTIFDVRVVDLTAIAPKDVADSQVVLLANVPTVSPEVKAALADLLKRGGGLMLLPGDRVRADVFNSTFADVSPCRLGGLLEPKAVAGRAAETPLAAIDMQHPVFEEFLRPHNGDLTTARFNRYFEAVGSQAARVLARFQDGERPAILEQQIGPGVSIIMLSPVDLQWNSLPMRAVFLPFMHQAVRYLAVRSEPATACEVGQQMPVPAGCQLKNPKGQAVALALKPDGKPLPSAPASECGFWTLTGADGKTQLVYAVNRPSYEADPTVLDAQEVVQATETPAVDSADTVASAGLGPMAKDDMNLWWYALLAAAVLMLAELLLANRTLRH
jgi:hypothetical protein